MKCYDIDDYTNVSTIKRKNEEAVQILISVISLIASLSIVFILTLRYKKLVEDKPFMFPIYMIAISDTMVSLSYSFGYPMQGPLCSVQAFIFMLFGRASWLFTLLLIYQLFCLAIYHKVYLSNRFSFKLVWSVTIFAQTLPFCFKTWYGIANNLAGSQSCYFNGDNREVFIFLWVCEQIVVFSLLIAFSLRIIVHGYYQSRQQSVTIQNASLIPISKTIKTTMVLYPLSMLMSWSPSIVYIFINNSNYLKGCFRYPHPVYVFDWINMLIPLYGFFLSIIFYTRTKNARDEWIQLFKSSYTYTMNRENKIKGSVDLSPLQNTNDFI